MKITIKQSAQFLLAFILGYLFFVGLYPVVLKLLAQRIEDKRRRSFIAFMKYVGMDDLPDRDNCFHCEHWHKEGMECCLCRMPPKDGEAVEIKEKVTIQ